MHIKTLVEFHLSRAKIRTAVPVVFLTMLDGGEDVLRHERLSISGQSLMDTLHFTLESIWQRVVK